MRISKAKAKRMFLAYVLISFFLSTGPVLGVCPVFSFSNLSEEEVRANFRFRKVHLKRIYVKFAIPDTIILPNRSRVHGFDALLILLRRLSYPNRLLTLAREFNKQPTVISLTVTWMTNYLFSRYGYLLFFHPMFKCQARLQMYADSITRKGAPTSHVVAFIDGTIRPLCRPVYLQVYFYNGM